MNDGQARCQHGNVATYVKLSRYDEWVQPYATECEVCAGEPCGIPVIVHPKPKATKSGQ